MSFNVRARLLHVTLLFKYRVPARFQACSPGTNNNYLNSRQRLGRKLGGDLVVGDLRVRLLYYYEADPQTFNIPSILSYAFANGELNELEPTLTVMEGFSRPFCYMGYYQDVDREVMLDAIRRFNVEIVRRWKLGYGNIFMERITGAWAFHMPAPLYRDYFRSVNEAFDILVGKVFLKAIHRLGVLDAYFVPPNDIRVKGKKLCGTGVSIERGSRGEALFFNAFTNLRHPDPELSFKVLNIPPEKLKDKGIQRPQEYFASRERDGIRGAPKPGEFRDALVESIEEVLGVKVYEGSLSDVETRIWNKYLAILRFEDFIFRRSTKRFMKSLSPGELYGFAQEKYRKLVQASVAVTRDGVITKVMITGDYGITPPDADEEIASALIGLRVDQFDEAVKKVKTIMSKPGYEITGATVEEFVTPVFVAAKKALEGK
jgi:lipoate-protein ligase A